MLLISVLKKKKLNIYVSFSFQFYEISEALILHEMGVTFKNYEPNCLTEIIQRSNKDTPVICIESPSK